MNKLVVVNKNKGITSRDVVNELNHIFLTKRIGHTGTLDPIASGVLVCLIGKYTKLVPLITSYDKEYIAEIKIGIKTDTGDITGNIIDSNNNTVKKEDIIKVFKDFPKSYEQIVPKYSAVKINGKKLYEYARNKENIELPKRLVNIYSLELLDFKDNIIIFRTKVSKGTYIRSLIEDICNKLNILGTMNNLIRTKQGNFTIDNSYSLDDIRNGNYNTLSLKDFLDYPIINLDDETYELVKNGNKIVNKYNINNKVIFMYQDREIAIYKLDNDLLRVDVML